MSSVVFVSILKNVFVFCVVFHSKLIIMITRVDLLPFLSIHWNRNMVYNFPFFFVNVFLLEIELHTHLFNIFLFQIVFSVFKTFFRSTSSLNRNKFYTWNEWISKSLTKTRASTMQEIVIGALCIYHKGSSVRVIAIVQKSTFLISNWSLISLARHFNILSYIMPKLYNKNLIKLCLQLIYLSRKWLIYLGWW